MDIGFCRADVSFPCLEVESIFLTAGGYGLQSVLLFLVYGVCSILSIMLMIYLVYKEARYLPIMNLLNTMKSELPD